MSCLAERIDCGATRVTFPKCPQTGLSKQNPRFGHLEYWPDFRTRIPA